jgi:hypothetical protein
MDLAVDLHRLVDHQLFRQVFGMDLKQRYLNIGLAPAAVKLELQRINTTAIDSSSGRPTGSNGRCRSCIPP